MKFRLRLMLGAVMLLALVFGAGSSILELTLPDGSVSEVNVSLTMYSMTINFNK